MPSDLCGDRFLEFACTKDHDHRGQHEHRRGMFTSASWPARRPLSRGQRRMLRDAYEYMVQHGGKPGGWSTLLRPCPRIGDLRVLNGLALRGLMTDGDHDDRPHRVEVWPKWIRITAAGAREWERLNDALNGHLEHTCSRSARVPPTGSST